MTTGSEIGSGGVEGAKGPAGVEPFADTLERHGLSLVRDRVRILQVNTGYLCNLRCRHCHLEAGPDRPEVMSRETMEAVIALAGRFPFPVIDVTGGAPEMVPGVPHLIERLSALAPRLMLRTNLTALECPMRETLLDLCIDRKVVLVASFPSANPSRTDSQRGAGFAEAGAAVLRKLNAAGYGVEGSGLELDLVSNPDGAILPLPQDAAERKYRQDMRKKWGVTFNRFYSFANAPLGRFRGWLEDSGKYGRYMKTLEEKFNPCAVDGLMCRTLISVSWDGYLYDCDFNLAAGLFLGGRKRHVSEIRELPPPGAPIATGDHCYACAAGSGFT